MHKLNYQSFYHHFLEEWLHYTFFEFNINFNVTLFLQIGTKLLLNIFCNIYLGFEVHFK